MEVVVILIYVIDFFFHFCDTFSIHTYNYYEIFCYLLFLNRNRNLKE